MISVLPLMTPGLGDRSSLVHDGRVALLVDPQRDHERVLALARHDGVEITHVFETHIHGDYVTGGFALARAVGAEYLVNAEDPVSFARTPLRDGDDFDVGQMTVRVLHTPGHTFTHLAYAVAVDGAPVAVFTGGSLLHGAVGCPELVGPEHARALAHAQWHSVHRLANVLPEFTPIYPTHGFGSFCSVAPVGRTLASTVGREKSANPVLNQGEQDYVDEQTTELDPVPVRRSHIGAMNLAGPERPDLSPPGRVDAVQLRRRIDGGEWVVDLREHRAFAAGHVAGSFNVELNEQLATYLEWLVSWNAPITLLGVTEGEVDQAQRELVRIGIERPVAAATGDPHDWAGLEPLVCYPRATFHDLADALAGPDPLTVLDVRLPAERTGSYVRGSLHVPIPEVLDRIDQIPERPLWVLGRGRQAGVIAALLHAHGGDVTAVDDDFANAAGAGVPLISRVGATSAA